MSLHVMNCVRKGSALPRGRFARAAAGVRPLRRGIAAFAVSVVAAAGLLTSCAPAPVHTIASTGDSIARGFDACGLFTDCPGIAYSTGSDPGSGSVYRQLLGISPGIAGNQYNDAEVGARADDLFGQMALAAWQKADFVTVLIGANDACAPTVGQMTSVESFRAGINSAFNYFFSQRPGATVVVSSIPDLYRVWEVAHGNAKARALWNAAGLCQSLLANPSSNTKADKLRRAFVSLQIQKYNTVLGEVCRAHGGCRYDGGATYRYGFTVSQLSAYDYFHPNAIGHRALARLTWRTYKAAR
jgi:lysophospholipase L1-like esterase